MPELSVSVKDRDITISEPGAGFSVTYRKLSRLPMLVALDDIRRDPDRQELSFLVQAWKAAFHKAKSLGWLN
jgi:hypothetical protein